ncbi:MAG: ATP-binding protein [Armatimonadota bacterium]|nr:ATP-binding protein [Armatimonadota bacterium]
MENSKDASELHPTIELSEALKEEALRIINISLEEARTQHPLDVPGIFSFERPTLGPTVPIKLYRAVRLLAFRELLGSNLSAAMLNVAGQMVAQKIGIRGPADVIDALEDFGVGKGTIEEQTDDHLVISLNECATCSGAPNIGEPLCHFESGIMSAGLSAGLGTEFTVEETRCWGLGDTTCLWVARRSDGQSKTLKDLEPLEMVAMLAGKAATALDTAVTIREKNRLIREAYHELRQSERMKKDLIDMIVHDMRTPLSAAISSMLTLAEMTKPRLSPQEETVLQMAIHGAQTLLGMINDLLDVSKMESNKVTLHKTPTRVNEVLREAISQVEILAKRKRLELHRRVQRGLPELEIDRDRIVRTVVNLLSNAVRHTPPGGRISVEANLTADKSSVAVSVSDTGEGIPKEYHARIFDKFVQVEPQWSRRKLSTGLGLAFCKLVVEAHGGTISVESEPGCGSTFTFTLPVRSS